MKATLLDIILYVYRNYPEINQLSKPRLVKLIYLIDWKNSIENGNQISDINWYYNHYGPYVDDVINLIKSKSEFFDVTSYANGIGSFSDKITFKDNRNYNVNIDKENQKIIDFVIDKTKNLNWNDFITLVYDTYPVKKNSKYSNLDLVGNARDYNEIRLKAQSQ